MSVPKEQVIKTMNSSGTGGQQVSQIFLDKETATLQVKVLSKIVGDFIGPKRLPMLIIDAQSTVSSRYKFSARTAGILGFSMFGRDVTFALDDQMQLNLEVVKDFLIKHDKEEILIFGFTFMVWRYFLLEIEKSKIKINIGKGILIHGGGWKQMLRDSVSNDEFKRRLKESIGIAKVHNYYGMVEQTGSIFMECEHGHLHASTFSEIVIRDPITFKPKQPNAPGLIQLLSVIPKSYPGHSILSEDIGQSLGVDDCACKRNGQYFKVHGRLKNAEIRGCSDTYSA
jgi:phenylacetate-coenzyme A ligase PaaK-like adenylate-forming protein